MKLITLVGAALLLAGCSTSEATVTPTVEPSADTADVSDLDKTSGFCDVHERWEETYREAMGDPVDVFAIEKLAGWANSLEEEAPLDIAETVQTYIEPIRMVESSTDGSVDAIAWTQASNTLNQGCIGDLIDK